MAPIMIKGITENTDNYVIENKHISFTIDKNNGKVTKIINLYNGKDVKANDESPEFIFLTDFNENKILPVSLETDNAEIKVTFENSMTLNMRIQTYENYITVELTRELPKSVKYVTFANLITNLTTADSNDDFLLNGMAMTAWIKPIEYGYTCPSHCVSAEAYTVFERGMKGAKYSIVFSKKRDAIDYLKEVADAIDIKVGLTSKAGGPYAREWKGNYGDYAIVTRLEPEKLDESLRLSTEFSVDEYDVHQMAGRTFTQGNFEFANTENGTAKEYAETLGKKIKDAGLITALHNYAYYIDPHAHDILSTPKWQQQLRYKETYELSEDVDAEALELPTLEDASGFDTRYSFLHTNMSYVLVDEEIIKIGKATEPALAECVRGACGTKAVPHKKGAVLKHLDGVFGMFTPDLGSELFYHVADLTAKAYNEGGFDMLYFDAIDGIGRHIDDRRLCWYYHQMFIHRVLSQCERTPLIETSSGCPQEWNFRGRSGAWDYAHFSVKKHVLNHVTANLKAINKHNMTATLGWFCFFTDENIWGHMKNTNFKTLFHDDLDFLGMYAVLYDMSIVFHPLAVDPINNNPFYYDNIKYYTEHYTKLRKAHYFKPEIIERVKSVGGEWRIIPRGKEFAFQQISYSKANLGNYKGVSDLEYSDSNPFGKQNPFVRIEARYSTLYEEPFVLVPGDENKPIGQKKLDIPTTRPDIDARCAMSMRVKGTGRDGDGALISLSGGVLGEHGGRADFFVDLNFEGWRDFFFLEWNNAEYDTQKYVFDGISTTYSSYDTFRFSPNLFQIKNAAIRVCGETGENAVFGDLITYPQTQAPIKNPTVKVGDSTMTFNCELHGGDYIEYDPVTSKATLFHNSEQTKEEIEFTGMLTVDNGDFTATYSADVLSDAPLRAKVCLGFIGEELMN